jgi:hypothetical protein
MDMQDGLGKSNSSSGGMPSTRWVRWVFNDYIDGPSIRKTVAKERNNRFWRIPIEKARIDLDEQLFDAGGEGEEGERSNNIKPPGYGEGEMIGKEEEGPEFDKEVGKEFGDVGFLKDVAPPRKI